MLALATRASDDHGARRGPAGEEPTTEAALLGAGAHVDGDLTLATWTSEQGVVVDVVCEESTAVAAVLGGLGGGHGAVQAPRVGDERWRWAHGLWPKFEHIN